MKKRMIRYAFADAFEQSSMVVIFENEIKQQLKNKLKSWEYRLNWIY